jgi:hypothetical protein
MTSSELEPAISQLLYGVYRTILETLKQLLLISCFMALSMQTLYQYIASDGENTGEVEMI